MDLNDPKTQAMYRFLRRGASEWKLFPYEVVAEVGRVPAFRLCFTERLGMISEDTYEKHGIFLTSIVVGKHTGVPAPQYFNFLRDYMKIDVPVGQEYQTWARHVREAHKFYAVD